MSDAMKSVIIGLHRMGNEPYVIAKIFYLTVDEVKNVINEYFSNHG